MEADQAAVDELVDDLFAQPLDVHGAAAGEGAEHFLDLPGALLAAGTAVEDTVLVALDRAAADGTFLREVKNFFLAGADPVLGAQDVRDDLARLDDTTVSPCGCLSLRCNRRCTAGVAGAVPTSWTVSDGRPASVPFLPTCTRISSSDRLLLLELVGHGPARRPAVWPGGPGCCNRPP
jgi:hypothetical protein